MLKAGGHGAIPFRDEVVKKPRPGSGANPGGVEQVFQPHRDAVQRPPIPAGLNLRLRPLRRGPGVFRQQGNKGVQNRFGGRNAGKVGVNDFHRGNFLAANPPGKFPGAQIA